MPHYNLVAPIILVWRILEAADVPHTPSALAIDSKILGQILGYRAI